jgi:hypothetical protein
VHVVCLSKLQQLIENAFGVEEPQICAVGEILRPQLSHRLPYGLGRCHLAVRGMKRPVVGAAQETPQPTLLQIHKVRHLLRLRQSTVKHKPGKILHLNFQRKSGCQFSCEILELRIAIVTNHNPRLLADGLQDQLEVL